MSMRDRPKLSERLRGKMGDDLFDKIKKEFEDDRKTWFHDRPSFSNFKREGFPFESENPFGAAKSDTGIKTHLEDLAKKHPEFATNLKCPPWGGSLAKTWDKAFTVPVAVEEGDLKAKEHNVQSQEDQPKEEAEGSSKIKSNDNLKQHNLRNTVDIGEQIQKANQEPNDIPKRSSSAPPNTLLADLPSTMNKQEPKRFTSKIEITPVNPYEKNVANSSAPTQSDSTTNNSSDQTANPSSSNAGSPFMGRPRTSSSGAREIPIVTERTTHNRSPYDSPTMGRKQPQVRNIPIFVEGRKDPVVAKSCAADEPVEQSKQVHQEQAPVKRKLDNGKAAQTQPANGQSHQKQQPPQQETELPVENPTSPPPPTHPPPPSKPKDPMERVQEVKEEVESFIAEINQFSGNSRTDKAYLYLDEMLTRNLIKLDTIEVEGNNALRSARKDVIRQIQNAIALLESKVPVTNSEENPENKQQSADASSTNVTNVMEIDNTQTKDTTNNADTGTKKASG